MPKSKKQVSSRVSKLKLSPKHKIKPWMVTVFLLLIIMVGTIVVYRSFASELPQSVIDEIKYEIMIDGRAKVMVKSLNYERIFSQADTAKALADENYKNQLYMLVLEDLRKLYDKQHPPSQTPTQPTPITPSPVQPTSPSQQPSQQPGQTPTQPSSPDKPATSPSNNIESQDQAKEAINSLEYDLQDPATMPTYSNVAAFKLIPPENIAQADTVGIYVDRELYRAIKPADKEFKIDTARFKNGVHRLDVVIYDKSDIPLARYVFMFKSQNELNFLDRAIAPLLGLLGL